MLGLLFDYYDAILLTAYEYIVHDSEICCIQFWSNNTTYSIGNNLTDCHNFSIVSDHLCVIPSIVTIILNSMRMHRYFHVRGTRIVF